MKRIFIVLAIWLIAVGVGKGQGDAASKQYFEGMRVTLKIDMPATNNGVNLYPDREQQWIDSRVSPQMWSPQSGLDRRIKLVG